MIMMKKFYLKGNFIYKFSQQLCCKLIVLLLLFFSFLNVPLLQARTHNQFDKNIQQQAISISGVVKDSQGETLVGVSVKVKGTVSGTMTDMDGKFQLDVPSDAILEFSYVGFTTLEVPVNGQKVFDIVLRESALSLGEVIVTGVASGTPKQKLGFSIEKISAEKLLKVPATDAASALQGKVAGVRVTKSSGAPGSESDVQLRGVKMIVCLQAKVHQSHLSVLYFKPS